MLRYVLTPSVIKLDFQVFTLGQGLVDSVQVDSVLYVLFRETISHVNVFRDMIFCSLKAIVGKFEISVNIFLLEVVIQTYTKVDL